MTQVIADKFNGYDMLSFVGGGAKPFSLSLSKVLRVLECADEIREIESELRPAQLEAQASRATITLARNQAQLGTAEQDAQHAEQVREQARERAKNTKKNTPAIRAAEARKTELTQAPGAKEFGTAGVLAYLTSQGFSDADAQEFASDADAIAEARKAWDNSHAPKKLTFAQARAQKKAGASAGSKRTPQEIASAHVDAELEASRVRTEKLRVENRERAIKTFTQDVASKLPSSMRLLAIGEYTKEYDAEQALKNAPRKGSKGTPITQTITTPKLTGASASGKAPIAKGIPVSVSFIANGKPVKGTWNSKGALMSELEEIGYELDGYVNTSDGTNRYTFKQGGSKSHDYDALVKKGIIKEIESANVR